MKQFNFTLEQIQRLFTMQDELNSYIHPEWKVQGFCWGLAINDEVMEILGHLGWKWWKKDYKQGVTEENKAQIKLETIDILHFVVSRAIEIGWKPESFLQYLNVAPNPRTQSLYELALEMFDPSMDRNLVLVDMFQSLDMTESEILETYAQKYVLNKFRQDNGYKDGTYAKEWKHTWFPDGMIRDEPLTRTREDNEVLAELVVDMRTQGLDTTDPKALYSGLESVYNSRLNKQP